MATIVLSRAGRRGVPGLQDMLARAGLWWGRALARRAAQRSLEHLAGLGPRLMRDAGVEPSSPQGWEAVRPNGLLVRRR